MWKYYALLSSIFAKIGVKDINSNDAFLPTSLCCLHGVFATMPIKEIKSVGKITFLFLRLSAISTGLS